MAYSCNKKAGCFTTSTFPLSDNRIKIVLFCVVVKGFEDELEYPNISQLFFNKKEFVRWIYDLRWTSQKDLNLIEQKLNY